MPTPRKILILATFALVSCNARGLAQHVLHFYGPPGPLPAISEAAEAFQAKTGVQIEIQFGTLESWTVSAEQDADLVYATADYLMSRYLRTKDLHIDPESVTPLYMQSSIILVRPDNPKEIKDFPDLLKPNLKVMIVTGTGMKELWEDMAGRLEDIRTLRTLRKNVALVAETGEEAMRLWKERSDMDAWVTWNVWFVPLRSQAKLVPVSKDYGIHRRSSVALTHRGKGNPLAAEFVKFLSSPEGFKVFESWGWVRGSNSPLAVNTDICAVCRVNEDHWTDGVGATLLELRRLMQDYEALGIQSGEVHISAVFDGNAAYWLLTDKAYQSVKRGDRQNPNRALIEELVRKGVSVELSEQAMRIQKWQAGDILPEVKLIPNAQIRIIDLQQQGYAQIILEGPRDAYLRYQTESSPSG